MFFLSHPSTFSSSRIFPLILFLHSPLTLSYSFSPFTPITKRELVLVEYKPLLPLLLCSSLHLPSLLYFRTHFSYIYFSSFILPFPLFLLSFLIFFFLLPPSLSPPISFFHPISLIFHSSSFSFLHSLLLSYSFPLIPSLFFPLFLFLG